MKSKALKHLKKIHQLYPETWRLIDNYRLNRGKTLPDWPSWCFLPMSRFLGIMTEQIKKNKRDLTVDNFTKLIALGTWRITQGIYRFDQSLETALIASPISGDFPVEAFYRLPEWCVYIETGNIYLCGDKVDGFFVHLDYDDAKGKSELCLLIDIKESLLPFFLPMGNWGLLDSINMLYDDFIEFQPEYSPFVDNSLKANLARDLQQFLSLVLYICSEAPEYSGSLPSKPQPVKIKKGLRFFAPEKPKIIEVGKSIGKALKSLEEHEREHISGRSVRPHIRRGHWHRFWVGKKNDNFQSREMVFRWLAPMGVNTDYLLNSSSDIRDAA